MLEETEKIEAYIKELLARYPAEWAALVTQIITAQEAEA